MRTNSHESRGILTCGWFSNHISGVVSGEYGMVSRRLHTDKGMTDKGMKDNNPAKRHLGSFRSFRNRGKRIAMGRCYNRAFKCFIRDALWILGATPTVVQPGANQSRPFPPLRHKTTLGVSPQHWLKEARHDPHRCPEAVPCGGRALVGPLPGAVGAVLGPERGARPRFPAQALRHAPDCRYSQSRTVKSFTLFATTKPM